MVQLIEIDRHNYLSVIDLAVSDEQKRFVASNMYSLAQAYVQPECIPFALYAENKPVGFVMYAMDEDDHEYWIFRLMNDKKFQRKGYGREAMHLLNDRIRADQDHRIFYTVLSRTTPPPGALRKPRLHSRRQGGIRRSCLQTGKNRKSDRYKHQLNPHTPFVIKGSSVETRNEVRISGNSYFWCSKFLRPNYKL